MSKLRVFISSVQKEIEAERSTRYRLKRSTESLTNR
jgi:hypothetical protein